MMAICVYLTFSINTNTYNHLCKFCHNGCVYCCTKLVNRSKNNNIIKMDFNNQKMLEICHDQSLSINHKESVCPDGKNCIIIDQMNELLASNSKQANYSEKQGKQHEFTKNV